MATNKPITSATAVTTPAATDLFAVSQGAAGKKMTLAQIHELSGRIIYATTTEASIANTTDETTLWQFSVPADLLGTAQLLVVDTWIEVLNNSGGNRGIQYKLKYGDTTVASSTSGQMTPSGTPNQFYHDSYIKGAGATNSQQGAVRYSIDNKGLCYGASGTAAEDSTGALNLTLTGKFAFAHASLTCTMRWAVAKIITI